MNEVISRASTTNGSTANNNKELNELESNLITSFIDYLNETGIYYRDKQFKKGGKIRLINSIQEITKLKAYNMTKDKTIKTTMSDKELIERAKELLLKEQERKERAKKAKEQEESYDSFGEPIHAETQQPLASFSIIEDVLDMFYINKSVANDRLIFMRKEGQGFELSAICKQVELTKKLSEVLVNDIAMFYPDKYNDLMDAITIYNEGREKPISDSVAILKYLTGVTFATTKLLDKDPVNYTTNKNTPTLKYLNIEGLGKASGFCGSWDNFTGRLSIKGIDLDAEKFYRAFVWSILEESDTNRSFLYLYDQGKTGKSVTARVLQNFLGTGASGCSTTFDFTASGSHQTELLIGKRFIVQNESWAKKLVSNSLLKAVTGGDTIMINPKNKPTMSVFVQAKVMVLSNEKPVVGMSKAELSRLLPITVAEMREEDYSPTFEEDLKNELPVFLTKCKKDYYDLKNTSKTAWFLSIEEKLAKSDDFRDFYSQVVANLFDQYRFERTGIENGQKHLEITTIISKIIREDQDLKDAKLSVTSPAIFEALDREAKKHNGRYSQEIGKKGFKGVRLVERIKKESDIPL